MERLALLFISFYCLSPLLHTKIQSVYQKKIQSVPEYNLKASSIWESDEWILYNPDKLAVLGSYLIVLDERQKNKIFLFNRKNKKLMAKLGREGKGPGEFLSPWYIFTAKRDTKRFCIYDGQLRRISCYNLKNVLKKSDDKPLFSLTLSGNTGIPLRLNSFPKAKKFIVTGIFSNAHRYMVINSSGDIIKKSKAIPYSRINDVPLNISQQAFTVFPVSNYKGTKIAFAYVYKNTLAIYSKEGKLLNQTMGPGKYFSPKFLTAKTPYGPTFAQNGETKVAYVDLNSSKNHIYALHSGRPRKSGVAGLSQTLYVYNWNGELNSIFHLDRNVLDCAVTLTEEVLYCIDKNVNNYPAIVEYKLPELDE